MIFDLNATNGSTLQLPEKISKTDADDAYIASPELSAAVWTALTLGQPLLLTGEPGTGKTQLAQFLAHRFGFEFIRFDAQTSSVKKDLFYTYDALGHFQRAQMEREKALDAAAVAEFIACTALGKAIELANEEDKPKRSVVLIDEIDKAPRDLPNDLLGALDTLSFSVPEIPGERPPLTCPDNLKPIIIITSNSEKNLPDAFLRRVVYHHITFPDTGRLLEILTAKKLTGLKESDLKTIITHFEDIRSDDKGLNKVPATAELIQWATLLPKLEFPIAKLANVDKLTAAERKLLHISYGVLAKNREDLEKLTSVAGE